MAIAELPGRNSVEANVAALSTETFSGARLSDALHHWRALESEIGYRNWSCSADWVAAYVEHYGDFAEIEAIFVSRDGARMGAGLLCRKNLSKLGPLGFHALLNGTGGEPDGDPFYCEHHQLLALPEDYAAVEEAVTRHGLERSHVDAVYWSGYNEAHVASLMDREPRCEVTEFTHEAIPLAQLQAATHYGTWIDCERRALAPLERLIEWNRSSWGHVGEGLYTGRYERFLIDVTQRLIQAGRAAVVATERGAVVLFFGGPDASTVYAYADGATDDDAMKDVHLAAARLAAERGFDRYDFAVNAADATRGLGTVHRPVLWVRIPQPTWRSQLLFGLSRVKRRLRQE